MKKIIFASNNQHKADEIRHILGGVYEIITLKDAGIDIDIPEPHETFAANALEKSMTIYKMTGMDCFAEDTGLEVLALNGAPGVLSARYAGEHGNDLGNIKKLLHELENIDDRTAQFKTVISLLINGENHTFEGVCRGTIALLPQGSNGFGYDPIFIPEGYKKTFAECTPEEKNLTSHRKKAISKMIEYLHGK